MENKAKTHFWSKWIERPPKIFRRFYIHGIFRIKEPDDAKTIYLTFDDGPIPETTPWVLDILDRYGVKATFFMVGDNVRKYPHLYEEIKRRGHGVGNHTMHHLQGSRTWTTNFIEDVTEASKWIESSLFRPPHGWMRFGQTEILRHRFRIIMYDLVTRDYSMLLSAEDVFHNVQLYARPGGIVVFHDSLRSRPRLREALPRSIEWLINEGYEFRVLQGK